MLLNCKRQALFYLFYIFILHETLRKARAHFVEEQKKLNKAAAETYAEKMLRYDIVSVSAVYIGVGGERRREQR